MRSSYGKNIPKFYCVGHQATWRVGISSDALGCPQIAAGETGWPDDSPPTRLPDTLTPRRYVVTPSSLTQSGRRRCRRPRVDPSWDIHV
ncbi:hypothetical protein PsYK624_007970 [Phanerochaete sordida]|uniref:Uncharacterized protein n=1 Tax=Phanerochaete sordida TaxID=48140 RepID=A0A9P3FY63_9APHY|nr:hypothetical protein PsYK624_007970 [Phanerochaete sordida]